MTDILPEMEQLVLKLAKRHPEDINLYDSPDKALELYAYMYKQPEYLALDNEQKKYFEMARASAFALKSIYINK